MDLASILLILALLLLTGWFVGRPLFDRSPAQPAPERTAEEQENHERSALLAERDRVLNALQDLDFDNTLGKIPQEDYPIQRQRLLARGAEVLRKLDALAQTSEPAETIPGEAPAMEDRLEAAVAARRADAAVAATVVSTGGNGSGRKRAIGPAIPDDDLEAALAARRRQRNEKAAGFCPKCGKPLQKSDRFCPKCGAKIA
jgi:hypothetical protein